jgi:hypothetical protein
MIPIKIQCDCGQRYAFDIEPVGGRMPWPVACPTCGADGTTAANAIIAQTAPSPPILVAERAAPLPAAAPLPSAQPAAAPAPMRVAAPAPSAPSAPSLRVAASAPSAPSAPSLRVAAPTQSAQPAASAPALRIASAAPPAQSAAPPPGLRVAAAAESAQPPTLAAAPVRSAPRRTTMLPGQVDRTQAEIEARAKISWGDPPKQVMGYLMMQGFSRDEAMESVNEMFRERAKTIRANGIKKIFMGIGLLCLPIVNVFIFMATGGFFTTILGATCVAALYGAYCILKGILMVVAPKGEKGDVTEQ